MAVGLALAERMLAARFNVDGHDVVDHFTWVIASDGDIQEGIASEASSLAGHLGLGKLIVFYDDNKIQLASPTALVFSEDVAARYEAYGWHVQNVGEDISPANLEEAAHRAQEVADRPSLIICRTHIGYGSPNKQDSTQAHGSALGEDEVRLTKEFYGWDPDKHFYVPDEALAHWRSATAQRAEAEANWNNRFSGYRSPLPRARGRARADRRRRRRAQGLGQQRPAKLRPRDRRVARHPRGLGQGDPVGRRERARARRRLRRPGELQRHRHRGRR